MYFRNTSEPSFCTVSLFFQQLSYVIVFLGSTEHMSTHSGERTEDRQKERILSTPLGEPMNLVEILKGDWMRGYLAGESKMVESLKAHSSMSDNS